MANNKLEGLKPRLARDVPTVSGDSGKMFTSLHLNTHFLRDAKDRMEPLQFTSTMDTVTLVNQEHNNTAAVGLTLS